MSFEGIPYIDPQYSDATLNVPLHGIQPPPFPPPTITVSDLINKRESSSRIFRKSPNAFFIYRKVFTNYLTSLNYKLTMIDVSRLVSNYWQGESREVKDAYAKIAKEIDVELKEKRKHNKKCPVIWKIDKKSKKQRAPRRRNSKNNHEDSTDNSLTKFRNTTGITFEYQNCPVPANEPNQKILRSPEEMDSQTSLESSPNSSSPIMNFPGIIQGYSVVNYDNSCESQSNKSEEEIYNLNQFYSRLSVTDISSEYNNLFHYDPNNNLYFQYSYPCNGNLACQQGNEFP